MLMRMTTVVTTVSLVLVLTLTMLTLTSSLAARFITVLSDTPAPGNEGQRRDYWFAAIL